MQRSQTLYHSSLSDIDSMIDQWIDSAVEHYRYHRWQHALAYVLSALETCWIKARKQQYVAADLLQKSSCLAIYTHNGTVEKRSERSLF